MLRRGFVFLALVISLAFVSCEQPVTNGGEPVNAKEPSITGQPQGGTWNVTTADTFPLTVTASSPDSEIPLGYQWYSNSSASNSGGTAVPGETNAALTLAKAQYTGDGPRYFYVVVTNTINDNGDGGQKTASVTSNAVTVTVTGNNVPAVNAQPPSITVQPQSGTWNVTTADTFSLTVTASSPDSEIPLGYQWHSNSSASNSGGTAMPGETNVALTLAKANYTGDGPRYFYVVVTNTIGDNGDGGNKTASASSNAVTVTVTGNNAPAVNAQPPSITVQPQGGTWDVTTADTFPLTITAASPDSEIPLGYQWYSNSSASTTGGTTVPGETNATLTLAKENYTTNGTHYFYLVVTNTINDNSDGGNKTASAASNAVIVTVTGNLVVGNAQQPVIAAQPQGRTWDVFATDTLNLTVGASVTDGGTLSYQWYATIGPAVLSRNNPVTPGGTSATLSLNSENYTTDDARLYFFADVTNTNTNVTGNQTATIASAIVTVAITGNVEFTYTTAPLPQELIGEWIKQETITISATEFSSQIPGWSDYDYGGTIAGHRSNGDGAGYITILYTQHWDTSAVGKYYVIHYKELTSMTMKYSGALKTSDPGFANGGGGGKTTQDEAEKTYTLTGGYYTSTFDDNAYTLVVKVP